MARSLFDPIPDSPPPPAAAPARKPAPPPLPQPPPRTSPPPPPAAAAPTVQEQFRVRFRRQLGLSAIILIAFITARPHSRATHSATEILALVVFFIGLVVTLFNWRCPVCSRYLYRRIYPASCPRCGVAFHG